MDNRNVLETERQRLQSSSGSAVQDFILARSKPIDVVFVCATWWESRVKQGVHVLDPTPSKLDYAKELSRRLGTYTVYCYRTNLNK